MSLVKLSGSAADDEVDMLYEAMAYTDHFSENQVRHSLFPLSYRQFIYYMTNYT